MKGKKIIIKKMKSLDKNIMKSMGSSYKNLKHVKAFKKIKEEEETEESTEDSRLTFSAFKCEYCKEHYDLVYDELHGEIICRKCGHVIQSNVQL